MARAGRRAGEAVTEQPFRMWRPSSLGRRFLCPGSGPLEAKAHELGLDRDTEWSAEGTKLHAALPCRMSLDGLEDEQLRLVGRAREWIAATPGEGPDTLVRSLARYEVSLELWPLMRDGVLRQPWRPILWGTADVLKERHVLDLKFGHKPLVLELVEPAMRAYAVMACQTYGWDTCRASVLHVRSGQEYSHEYKFEEAYESLLRDMEQAKADSSTYHPGLACIYCSAGGICAALHKEAALVPHENHLATVPIEKALQAEPLLERLLKAIKQIKAAIPEAELGRYGLKRRAVSVRKVRSVLEAWGRLQDHMSQEDFLMACNVHLGALESILGKNGGKKRAKDILESCVDRVTTYQIVKGEPDGE